MRRECGVEIPENTRTEDMVYAPTERQNRYEISGLVTGMLVHGGAQVYNFCAAHPPGRATPPG